MALIFQATAHAIRGEQEAMEAMITEAILAKTGLRRSQLAGYSSGLG